MDIWAILGYVLAVVLNIGAVGAIRLKAYEKGKQFLASGRFAMIAVFVLCFLELLITGRFEALQDPQALIGLIERAWALAAATFGGHAVLKTGNEALGK